MESPNPYRPTSETTPLPTSTQPLWRRVVASTLRVFGGILIAIPLIAIALSVFETGVKEIAQDWLAIFISISFYIGLGWLFIFFGDKVASAAK